MLTSDQMNPMLDVRMGYIQASQATPKIAGECKLHPCAAMI